MFVIKFDINIVFIFLIPIIKEIIISVPIVDTKAIIIIPISIIILLSFDVTVIVLTSIIILLLSFSLFHHIQVN